MARSGGNTDLSRLLRSTKWRTHSNLVVNYDVVSWVSCAYRRELFFIRRAGGRAGRLAMTSHSRIFIYFKTCDEHVST